MKREEHRMLALSTGHLTERTRNYLDAYTNAVHSIVYYPKGDFGWFVYVPEKGMELEECKERCPEDLFKCISFASENGYHWIMFDRDVELIDELPEFGEKAKEEFKDKCFKAYQLDWIMSHGMSLTDLFDTFKGYVRGCYDISIQEGEDLKNEYGVKLMDYALEAFNECEAPVWACKEKFLDSEFKDKEYMTRLFERMPDTEALKSCYQRYNL